MSNAKIRLFVEQSLTKGKTIPLSPEQAHYLFGVMRRSSGDQIKAFDGTNGEWVCDLHQITKRKGEIVPVECLRPQSEAQDIWIIFAPLKKSRNDMLVEKSVELGVAKIVPALTQYTNSDRIRVDRIKAQAIEAAEQCGATHVPDVADPQKLVDLIANWPVDRAMIFCDETKLGDAQTQLPPAPAALLIGPEGGFSQSERDLIASHPNASAIALGPRILRAETAAISALTLWQSQQGDW